MNNPQYSIDFINNTMSLRLPQFRSLEVLDNLMKTLDFQKSNAELEQDIHQQYPTFREFERAFPSLTFALATGVGKTILMGAFITYLYTNYGIKNFFVVAPNLTIYNKLIQDFGNPAYQKYVFKRIQPFVQNPPNIITGDTYKEFNANQNSLWDSININIFNIGKINAEVRGGALPQVKRLSEYIGQSYFDYLSSLNDLVVLMDESHHYRADRGMAVINELDPLLGLELTATPQVETSKGAVKFKNVVYEYSLARAITDGYVKEPAAATRRSFDAHKYSPDEVDQIKLTDGIRIHRNTMAELKLYAENENVREVKPFVLVVCKDTTHAAEIKELIQSTEFFDSYYADKVIEVHSNQKGSEKDENIAKLLSLESPDNKIEIVIHVNMLKEGWDVTNLYTIIPLRTAASLTLREQTIGRGLRLPYGTRTGNSAVDRLTIVAHDKFEEIIAAANEETSIIKKENVIDIEEDEDFGKEKEVVKPKTVFDDFIEQKKKNLKYARSEEKKQQIKEDIETAEAVGIAIEQVLSAPVNIVVPAKQPEETKPQNTEPSHSVVQKVITSRDLSKPEVMEIIKEKAKQNLEVGGQMRLDMDEVEKKIDQAIAPLVEQKVKSTIEIPDVILIPKGGQAKIYHDFDLNIEYWFDYAVPTDEILIENLKDNEVNTLTGEANVVLPDTLPNVLLNELLNQKEISYRKNAALLYKLVEQAIAFVGQKKTEDETQKTVWYHKKDIARDILTQMEQHSELTQPEYEVKLIRAAAPILRQDYTKFREDEILKYTATVPAYEIKKKVIGYFEKACHTAYKFDSVPEHTFSIVLERDDAVEKWLRPAPHQFKINWKAGHEYEPDFVVETADSITIVEIKAHNRVNDDEVQLKAKAARAYCDNVNTVFAGTGRKPWKYMLIMDSEINRSSTFADLRTKVAFIDQCD